MRTLNEGCGLTNTWNFTELSEHVYLQNRIHWSKFEVDRWRNKKVLCTSCDLHRENVYIGPVHFIRGKTQISDFLK